LTYFVVISPPDGYGEQRLMIRKARQSFLGFLRRRMFSLRREEVTCDKRGFRVASGIMRIRLEEIGTAFLQGYHAALECGGGSALAGELAVTQFEPRGFAFEGAAMGLALLDALTPWPARRVADFCAGAGSAHAYMVHVGVGWIWARMPFGRRPGAASLDPTLRWLAFDGWGFHEGFFHWPSYLAGAPRPRSLIGYELRAFDQGLGRSFWFVNGGDPQQISNTIEAFPQARRADLWSGIGLAATYAGFGTQDSLRQLRILAAVCGPQLAQGAAFAAKARQRAGNLTEYTDLATMILAGMPALDAARLCDSTLENLPADGPKPDYEVWRQRIHHYFEKAGQLQAA
jgi:hypothetical protein